MQYSSTYIYLFFYTFTHQSLRVVEAGVMAVRRCGIKENRDGHRRHNPAHPGEPLGRNVFSSPLLWAPLFIHSPIILVVEAGAMAVRRCKKEDLKRIAKATGGSVLLTLANLEGDESFDATSLGTCEEVIEERIADDECILIKTDNKKSSSIILRFVERECALAHVVSERRRKS
jgi:hypothetical protein